MKTILIQNHFFVLGLIALTAWSFCACNPKDEEVLDLPLDVTLIGTWDISSYSLDGKEWIGHQAESAYITFEAPVDSAGIFYQEIFFTNGDTVSLSGRYIIGTIPGQVNLYFDGGPMNADITIQLDKMHWESIQQEFPLIIEATKRE